LLVGELLEHLPAEHDVEVLLLSLLGYAIVILKALVEHFPAEVQELRVLLEGAEHRKFLVG